MHRFVEEALRVGVGDLCASPPLAGGRWPAAACEARRLTVFTPSPWGITWHYLRGQRCVCARSRLGKGEGGVDIPARMTGHGSGVGRPARAGGNTPSRPSSRGAQAAASERRRPALTGPRCPEQELEPLGNVLPEMQSHSPGWEYEEREWRFLF